MVMHLHGKQEIEGSIPSSAFSRGSMVEQRSYKALVVGSIPSARIACSISDYAPDF